MHVNALSGDSPEGKQLRTSSSRVELLRAEAADAVELGELGPVGPGTVPGPSEAEPLPAYALLSFRTPLFSTTSTCVVAVNLAVSLALWGFFWVRITNPAAAEWAPSCEHISAPHLYGPPPVYLLKATVHCQRMGKQRSGAPPSGTGRRCHVCPLRGLRDIGLCLVPPPAPCEQAQLILHSSRNDARGVRGAHLSSPHHHFFLPSSFISDHNPRCYW